ncbi:MAG: hypothetical protein ACOCWJ_06175 [Verrucomicrobiota bacterium]
MKSTDLRLEKGMQFNESVPTRDTATSRPTRQLSSRGFLNNTPTYHYGTAFTSDSRYLVFTTCRLGQSALIRAELETGELTILKSLPGFGGWKGGNPAEVFGGGGGFLSTRVALAAASGWVLAATQSQLLAVHVETLEERVLIENLGDDQVFGVPAGNCDGKKAYVPISPEHPDVVAGNLQPERSCDQALMDEFGGRPTTILEIDIETGQCRDAHHEEVGGTSHVLPNPSDPDLIMFDIDLPPTFAYYGDNCQSPRAHILRMSTGEKTPLRPANAHQFQSHTNWNHTGDRVYYHGPAREDHEQPVYMGGRIGEMFVGASNLQGESIWEINMPEYFYGHVSTHATEEAIVSDALVSSDLVTAIHYQDLDRNGCPRIEILARHNTDWQAMGGQHPHPHCHMSPDGRWLSYNRAAKGRTDVYVVEL